MTDDVGAVLPQGTGTPVTIPGPIFAAAMDTFIAGQRLETALRLMTGTRSAVHQGMAKALENLIDLERGRGTFDASLDTPTLAFAIVRVSDGFLYGDVIAERVPDTGRAVTAIEALLRGLDLVHRTPVTAGLREP